jgi:hypothetical protein
MNTKCICLAILLYLPISVSGQTSNRPQKIEEFGITTNCDDWMARSENLVVKLSKDQSSLGYIVYYGGRVNIQPYDSPYTEKLPRRGEAFARAAVIKSRFVDTFGIDENRIILVNGGYRETWSVELWVAPGGDSWPRPTPTIQESAIRFRKGRVRKQEYTCWEL